jgi:hypothetical protein
LNLGVLTWPLLELASKIQIPETYHFCKMSAGNL